jgi:exodeoxyribonuclease VII large subunit
LVRRRSQQIDDLTNRLRQLDLRLRLGRSKAHAAECSTHLTHALQLRMERDRRRLDLAVARIQQLSPLAVLERGYAMVYGPDGSLLRDPTEVQGGDLLHVRLQKGTLDAEVKRTS